MVKLKDLSEKHKQSTQKFFFSFRNAEQPYKLPFLIFYTNYPTSQRPKPGSSKGVSNVPLTECCPHPDDTFSRRLMKLPLCHWRIPAASLVSGTLLIDPDEKLPRTMELIFGRELLYCRIEICSGVEYASLAM